MFDFSNYSTQSKFYDNSNALVAGKMKYETAGLPFKELVVGLKPKIYLFLVDDLSKHKKTKVKNKNLVAKWNIKIFCRTKNVFETFDEQNSK